MIRFNPPKLQLPPSLKQIDKSGDISKDECKEKKDKGDDNGVKSIHDVENNQTENSKDDTERSENTTLDLSHLSNYFNINQK